MPVASLGAKKSKKQRKAPRKSDQIDGDFSGDVSGPAAAMPPGGAGAPAAAAEDDRSSPAAGDSARGSHGAAGDEDWEWEEAGPDEYTRYLANEEATKLLRDYKQTMLDSIKFTVDGAINPFAEQLSRHA
eukprot:7976045-Pyramimonas_sp.AAC.1